MNPRLEEAFRCARTGDPRAFRTVAEILGPDLVRFLTFFLHGDAHAAHDVAQETLVRAWDARGTFVNPAHLRRWCYHVARCKAVSWIRRRGPPGRKVESLDWTAPEGTALPEPAEPAPAPDPPGEEKLGALRRALKRLPHNYAGPVHLYYVQGCSTLEAAELLGIRRATVKMRLHRARRFLRREIQREDAEREGEAEEPCGEAP